MNKQLQRQRTSNFFRRRDLPLPGFGCYDKFGDTMKFLGGKVMECTREEAQMIYLEQRQRYIGKSVRITGAVPKIGSVRAVFIERVSGHAYMEWLKHRPGDSIYSTSSSDTWSWEWKVRVRIPDEKHYIVVTTRQVMVVH